MYMQTINSVQPRSHAFVAAGLDEALRLDQAIERFVTDVSRTQARALIALGAAWVNGERVQVLSRRIHNGDSVLI